MILELTEKEAEALRALVENRITAIGPEIHHTDTPAYRDALRQSRELLEGLLDRLQKPQAVRL